MTTQPRKAGEFSFLLFSWLCHRKWLVLFSLKFQRNNQQSTLTIDSTKGKTRKKAVFYRAVEMKQPHTI